MLNAPNEDIIIYEATHDKSQSVSYGTDKEKLKVNADLSEFYSPSIGRPTIKPIVMNPSEVMRDIQAKLTPLEVYVLKWMFAKKTPKVNQPQRVR